MKRYLAVGAGVLVLAGLGWGVAWWTGRGEVVRAIDAGVARLQEQGWTVAWDGREVGGFPFGYSVRLTGLTASDAETGFALSLPRALAETDGTDRIVVRMPDSFTAELPVPAPARKADPELPATIPAAGEADGLVLVLAADGTAELTADRLGWRLDDPVSGRRITQSIEGLEATTVPDAPGARYRMHADRIGIELAAGDAEGAADGAEEGAVATFRDVAIEGASTLPGAAALAEMLYAGAPGRAEGSIRTGAAELTVTGGAETPGVLAWRAGATSLRALLTSGRIELEAEARENVWTLTAPDPAAPVQGTVSVALARADYAMPMAPSAAPDAMALGLVLQEATADEELWERIDPGRALPRGPASLVIDVTGTARVTERIDRLRPGAPPPFEISTIALDEVSAAALGATLNATGEVEILQPIALPLGKVQVGVTGLAGLVAALGRAGLLAPEVVAAAEAIMAVYLRPATGEDAWTAAIGFTRDGVLVNGLPVR